MADSARAIEVRATVDQLHGGSSEAPIKERNAPWQRHEPQLSDFGGCADQPAHATPYGPHGIR